MMKLKIEIHNECLHVLQEKINTLQVALNDLLQGSENETKSSAGDKHETGRAMLQIEQEQLTKQLNALLLQKSSLDKIRPNEKCNQGAAGALIDTDKGLFYLSIAMGKLQVGDNSAIALSPLSPLGLRWMGAKPGDTVELNGIRYLAKMVC